MVAVRGCALRDGARCRPVAAGERRRQRRDQAARGADGMEAGYNRRGHRRGDGRWAIAAARAVGSTGKVFATEIDKEKLAKLRADVGKRKLQNVAVVESKEADTSLPAECCDAIFLRRVYHHLTQPVEFDAALLRSLKTGGRLAIIDFPPRSGLDPVEGVPANRGGHGIPQKVVIEELTAAGLQLEKTVNDWPDDDYCVLFVKK